MSKQRQLIILPLPASTMVRIAWDGGGELPDALKGSYTNHSEARSAIMSWMASSGRVEEEVALMKKDHEARTNK